MLCPTQTVQTHHHHGKDLTFLMSGIPLSPNKVDRNCNVSHMGWKRQHLLYPFGFDHLDGDPPEKIKALNLDRPACYFANHIQVADWAASVGLGQYSPAFRYHLINGRQLVTMDALSLQRLGFQDDISNLKMEDEIRKLSQRARRESAGCEVLPYLFYYYLNKGQPPPRRYHRELFQFTDPWRTETCKFIDASSNNMYAWRRYRDESLHYSNSR